MAKKSGGLSFEQVYQDLKQGKFEPIYFFTGEESYYIDILANFIAKHALPEHEKDFNQTVVYGRDTDVMQLESLAKQFPMMAERQVVIVKEAQDVRNLEKLEHYTNNPMKSTILVICYKNKKLDGRSKLAAALKKNAVYLETTKMYDNQLAPWVSKYLNGKGYKIKENAAQLLADCIGNDLSALANALEKLIILSPEGSEISTDLIEKNIGVSKDFNVFELQNAVGDKNILKANQIANHFGNNEKEHPLVMTIGLLYSFFAKIITYHYLADKSKSSMAVALKINPYFTDDYHRYAKNYSAMKTVKIVEYLRTYDLKSKGLGSTGAVSDGQLLKELLFKIMH